MYWIFKVTPDWIWLLVPTLGLALVLAGKFKLMPPYNHLLKFAGAAVVVAGIYILGLLHADRTWSTAAQELRARVEIAESQSAATNEQVNTQVVTKTQVIRERGRDVVAYIDREVVRGDAGCTITSEFITAHNRAAEPHK